MIHLLLIDDHGLFREGLAKVMADQPDFVVAGKASGVQDGLALLETGPIDIVLLDVDLGPSRGVEFVTAARARGFAGRILLVTGGLSEQEAIQYVQDGVSGIIHKHNPPEALCAAVRRVARGEVFLEPNYWNAMFRAIHSDAGTRQLTNREREVLKRVVRGLANKEIGAEIGVSEASVKASLQGLFDKLGVRTRTQLVKIALDQYREIL
jgi:DNA-binding NarL/FixJ family response regulator